MSDAIFNDDSSVGRTERWRQHCWFDVKCTINKFLRKSTRIAHYRHIYVQTNDEQILSTFSECYNHVDNWNIMSIRMDERNVQIRNDNFKILSQTFLLSHLYKTHKCSRSFLLLAQWSQLFHVLYLRLQPFTGMSIIAQQFANTKKISNCLKWLSEDPRNTVHETSLYALHTMTDGAQLTFYTPDAVHSDSNSQLLTQLQISLYQKK